MGALIYSLIAVMTTQNAHTCPVRCLLGINGLNCIIHRVVFASINFFVLYCMQGGVLKQAMQRLTFVINTGNPTHEIIIKFLRIQSKSSQIDKYK